MTTTDPTEGLTDLMDITLVRKAEKIAVEAHAGQVDKAGEPYVEHVRRVAARVDSGWGRATALLHDVLEDTSWTELDLMAAGMPEEVVSAVEALTHRKHEMRYDYYARIRAAGSVALAVKLADVDDNSDPERLASLDDGTRARLRHKYAKAREALTKTEETS